MMYHDTHNPKDNTLSSEIMKNIYSRHRLPNLNINLEAYALTDTVLDIIGLKTTSERAVMKVLLSAPRPMFVSEIYIYARGGVARTKVYYTIKKLSRMGLIAYVSVDSDLIEKPDVWEWWPDSRQRKHMANWLVGANLVQANEEYIRDIYLTWVTRCRQERKKQRLITKDFRRLLDLLDKRVNISLPLNKEEEQ